MNFWDAAASLPALSVIFLSLALFVAFAFEFINGFHDTANAVTTVIYTRTLSARPAVVYSGILNLVGVLVGGTAVAFSIVNLLPVDLLIEGNPQASIIMVLALLLSGVIWNLSTWFVGLPVSSSHTLIGAILGVGLAHSLLTGRPGNGVNWNEAGMVLLGLLISPGIGFGLAAGLLLMMKKLIRDPKLYLPPQGEDRPPLWIRCALMLTCGGVSFAHGANDGQKGMGLLLLVLIGFLPAHYSLNLYEENLPPETYKSATSIQTILAKQEKNEEYLEIMREAEKITEKLKGISDFKDLPPAERWKLRRAIYKLRTEISTSPLTPAVRNELEEHTKILEKSIEFVPFWVKLGVALALGCGTMIGYKRIVVTVAEKIGKTHLTYAQGAAAEIVAAGTIMAAVGLHLPVSTTHVLSSGVAGTMAANHSGIQKSTIIRIALAWILTLPASLILAGILFALGSFLIS